MKKLLGKLKPSNLMRAMVDQSPIGVKMNFHNVAQDTTFKSFFKKNVIKIGVEAKLVHGSGTVANLKKDLTSFKFKFARIVYPIFKKESAYNYFIISEDRYYDNPIFCTDIEINNEKESFTDLSKELGKKISFNYIKTTKFKGSKSIKTDYSRKLNLGRFYPEANHFQTNRLILNSVNRDFIKDIYEVTRAPNCSVFIGIALQKVKNFYLIYDLTVSPGGEFTDEYDDCFRTYSDDFNSLRYYRNNFRGETGSSSFKLKIK
jgi:hypothetical protein